MGLLPATNMDDLIEVNNSYNVHKGQLTITRFKLLLTTKSNSFGWDAKEKIETAIRNASITVCGSTPWVTVEAPEWKKPWIHQGGKFKKAAVANGITTDKLRVMYPSDRTRGEDPQDKLRCYYNPAPTTERPLLLCTWDKVLGWMVYADTVTPLLKLTAEQFQALLE